MYLWYSSSTLGRSKVCIFFCSSPRSHMPSPHENQPHRPQRNKQGDLEDKILKKNIPGKCTWWEKDSDDEGEGARADWVDRDASDPEREMTEMEKQKKWVDNDCPEPIRRTIMARQEKERARTGVKGVLADFDAWKLSADAGAFRRVSRCTRWVASLVFGPACLFFL